MDNLTATQDDLRRQLAGSRRPAWVRLVVGPVGDDRSRLLALQAIVGPCPKGWHEQTWCYAQCTFVAARITARRLGVWCQGGRRAVKLESVQTYLELPDSSQQIPCMHVPSLQEWSRLSMAWPSYAYSAYFANREQGNHPQGYLVGADEVPSFPTFAGAFNAFFYGKYAVSGVGNPEFGVATIHVLDRRARIRGVRVGAASLDVSLGGSDLRGARLELNSETYRALVDATKRAVVPLPEGLPPDAWLWLKAGPEWLDFRPLTEWGGRLSPDVDIDLPRDPIAELSRLVTQGEGPHVEYKEKLPDTQSEKRKAFKTAVAFANGDGGTIVFGIEDESRAVVGLPGDRSVQRRRLTDSLRDLINPSPKVTIEAGHLDGRDLLIVHVHPGAGTIYGLVLDGNKPEYFVRRDGTTFYARPDELAAIAAQRTSAAQLDPLPRMPRRR